MFDVCGKDEKKSLMRYSFTMSKDTTHIVQRDNPVLRKKAKSVAIAEIGTLKINKIIKDMSSALATQKDGIAIAAPQIGVSLQIFVVSGILLSMADKTYTGDKKDIVFINPKIIRASKDKHEVEEGCLSVRWLYGMVKRSTRVSLKAYNENGQLLERGASGILAQIFQHETDHLNGVLFIDSAIKTWEMTEEEIAEIVKHEHEK